ncbi:hypothetical protein [Fictibacillus fluitans]|uniref:BclA C-terminal domain-containing protein n=1 Tax=Fictibacillus fluitans TaxID=3058422 RepID=A0ABT8HT37_9BACL|nr:hypothetical protein [Fictibacillus sp. NE201]MDN4523934.1 hypothetical protein [Fictibacillus sp. NE201]
MRRMIKARKPECDGHGKKTKHGHHSKHSIYGSLNGTPVGLTLAQTGVNLDFVEAGPTAGMIANPDRDTITVKTPGVYEVTFSLTTEFVNTEVAGVNYSLFINEVIVDASEIAFFKDAGDEPFGSPGSKTILLNLKANDVISVRPFIFVGEAVYYRNPTLVVTKVDK